MGIGNPVFFFFSIFIAAVILMYFFRKHYRALIVPSNLLWEEVMKEWQASPWFHRLQRNLLLLLQVLILSLLMFALIKPYTLDDLEKKDHVIILLDTSASMNASKKGVSHFELAKRDIQSLIKDNKGDITLLGVGNSISTVVSKESNDQVVFNRLENISVTNDHEDMKKALRLGEALGKGSSSVIHVYSDSLLKADFKEEKINTPIRVHNFIPDAKNVSLTSFGVERSGTAYKGVAVIENQSDELQSGTITIYDDKKEVISNRLKIGRGKEAVIPLDELPSSPVLKARIDFQDDYREDDILTSVQATSKPSVLVLGEINPFLLKGFQSLGVNVKTIEENQLKTGDEIIVTTKEKWKELSVTNPALIIPGPSDKSTVLTTDVEVKGDDPLLKHVDFEKVFVEKAGSIEVKGLDSSARSGSVPLIQKGEKNGTKMVVLNLNLTDTDFPLHPGFPIFLHNAYQYLSEDGGFIGYFQPGEERTVSLAPGDWDIYSSEAEFMKEWGQGEWFKAPLTPGVYQAVQGDVTKYFSVVLDDREKQPGGEAFSMDPTEGKGEEERETIHGTLSSWFLMLAILILFIEWEVYRRGNRI
ncbi:vWA domain-containing protein [Rossellomorea sp. LJF3]|uniref:vWA domain-containing protein n=1 Tax=Rossellomorea sp. LJF3 TaxID=3126099 RepID=UPI00300CCAAE